MIDGLLARTPAIERRRGVPVHAQIERWLMDEITRGAVAVGDRLPGERDLAAALRVSRMTLRRALDGLARRGVLVRLPGRSGGAFVAEPKVDCDLTGLAGFTEQMRRAHRRAGDTLAVVITGRWSLVDLHERPSPRDQRAAAAVVGADGGGGLPG